MYNNKIYNNSNNINKMYNNNDKNLINNNNLMINFNKNQINNNLLKKYRINFKILWMIEMLMMMIKEIFWLKKVNNWKDI